MFSLRNLTTTSLLLLLSVAVSIQARSYSGRQFEDESLAVIPSPNEQQQQDLFSDDIQRVSKQRQQQQQQDLHLAAPSETAVPVYVSPFLRPEKQVANLFDSSSESSHAPPNYAPKPQQQAASGPQRDLKTAASYGHHHGGYSGHDTSGWLDMGAWTGGKGSFGWYADYPVGGGKHHYGHGRK